MQQGRGIRFGFQVAPVGIGPDHELYADVLEDCGLGHSLGYDAAWLLEHHFSDYYPTPSPLVHMAHIAAAYPDLGLGTSVLVLPWYHPLRLAGEIAMVNTLTRGTLHLGVGRGTAKSEYDAYGVDMSEARGRFAEAWQIVRTALAGQPFTFDGRFFRIPREVRVRPAPSGKPIEFYGAIGSPGSAAIMAELDLPPLCLAQFPDHLLTKILATWRARRRELGRDAEAVVPISIKLLIAETDAAAQAIARRYLPAFFDLQARHYEVDAHPWDGIAEYEQFSRMFGNMRKLTDPENLGPFISMNLIGSPETVERRIAALSQIGFNYFLVSAAIAGMPKSLRHEVYTGFAREVMPRFAAAGSDRGARRVAAG